MDVAWLVGAGRGREGSVSALEAQLPAARAPFRPWVRHTRGVSWPQVRTRRISLQSVERRDGRAHLLLHLHRAGPGARLCWLPSPAVHADAPAKSTPVTAAGLQHFLTQTSSSFPCPSASRS